jgi:hypothetical protein
MIAVHFGFAAAVKGKAPAAPLWALISACHWLDIVELRRADVQLDVIPKKKSSGP